MIIVAFGFGLWFCLMMALGAALRWKLHLRLASLLALPLAASVALAVFL